MPGIHQRGALGVAAASLGQASGQPDMGKKKGEGGDSRKGGFGAGIPGALHFCSGGFALPGSGTALISHGTLGLFACLCPLNERPGTVTNRWSLPSPDGLKGCGLPGGIFFFFLPFVTVEAPP